ncbi:MAG: hypothetical protein KDC28_01370 [Saprospiraceae bacterium]|nr:hypothetical protein [Saprospiraceae bacterium]MCB9317790.1 hypothetical protein [Lewinellaceae bacterium]
MQKIVFFALLAFAISWVSCKKDNVSKGCTQDDFIGVYSGTESCQNADDESTTYEIKKLGSDLVMTDGGGNNYNLTTDDCKFTIPSVNLILFELSGDGSLNGKELTVNVSLGALGFNTTCVFRGNKS